MADEELRRIFMVNLNHYLSLNGYRQADLARHMNVSSTTAAKWCTGQAMPRIDKIQSIATWLGVTKEDLLTDHSLPRREYFIRKETRDIAEFLVRHPGHKAIFDATKNMPEEDIALVRDLVMRMAEKNNGF